MKKFIRIGVDSAKNYFQVHALESESSRPATRKLKRSKMQRQSFCKSSPAKPCTGNATSDWREFHGVVSGDGNPIEQFGQHQRLRTAQRSRRFGERWLSDISSLDCATSASARFRLNQRRNDFICIA